MSATAAAEFAATANASANACVAACIAAADAPHSFDRNDAESVRWAYTLIAHNNLRDAEEAANYAAGLAFSPYNNDPETGASASMARLFVDMARNALEELQKLDAAASREWRAANREADRLAGV